MTTYANIQTQQPAAPVSAWRLGNLVTRTGVVAIALFGVTLSLFTSFALGGLVFTAMLLAMAGSSLMRYQDHYDDQEAADHWLQQLR